MCKLCHKKKSGNSRRLTWDMWQICINCFKDIKTSNILLKGFVRRELIPKVTSCLFDLKTVVAPSQGGMPFCNSVCRSKFYRREAIKKNGIAWWKKMAKENEVVSQETKRGSNNE